MALVAKERLYLNADKSEVVEHDSGEARYLLVGAGGEITQEVVDKYGIQDKVENQVDTVADPGALSRFSFTRGESANVATLSTTEVSDGKPVVPNTPPTGSPVDDPNSVEAKREAATASSDSTDAASGGPDKNKSSKSSSSS